MTHFFESSENIFKYFLFHLAALSRAFGAQIGAAFACHFSSLLVSSEALQFTPDFSGPSTFLKKDVKWFSQQQNCNNRAFRNQPSSARR